MAAFEVILGSALQLLDKGVQDHGLPPNRRRQSRPLCLTSREPQKLCDRPAASLWPNNRPSGTAQGVARTLARWRLVFNPAVPQASPTKVKGGCTRRHRNEARLSSDASRDRHAKCDPLRPVLSGLAPPPLADEGRLGVGQRGAGISRLVLRS